MSIDTAPHSEWYLPATDLGVPQLEAGTTSRFQASIAVARLINPQLEARRRGRGYSWQPVAFKRERNRPADDASSLEARRVGNAVHVSADHMVRWRSVPVPWDPQGGINVAIVSTRRYLYRFTGLVPGHGHALSTELEVDWRLPMSRRLAGALVWPLVASAIVVTLSRELAPAAASGLALLWADDFARCQPSSVNPRAVLKMLGQFFDPSGPVTRAGTGWVPRLVQFIRSVALAWQSASKFEERTKLVAQRASDTEARALASRIGTRAPLPQNMWKEFGMELAVPEARSLGAKAEHGTDDDTQQSTKQLAAKLLHDVNFAMQRGESLANDVDAIAGAMDDASLTRGQAEAMMQQGLQQNEADQADVEEVLARIRSALTAQPSVRRAGIVESLQIPRTLDDGDEPSRQ